MKVKEYKVDIANIKVNERYQRSLRPAWVRQLIKNYDETKVNQIVLSAHDDGSYFVIDGQHTIEATRVVKGEHATLSAKVFFGLSETEEAELFYSYNTDRKALSSGDKIRARYVMGEELVVNYFNSLNGAGVPWSFTHHGGPGSKRLTSHSTTIRVYDFVGKATAERALKIANESKHYVPNIVAGLMFLLYRVPDINTKILTEKLMSVPDSEILRTSILMSESFGYSPSVVKSGSQSDGRRNVPTSTRIYAKTIATIYNKGRSKGRIDINLI